MPTKPKTKEKERYIESIGRRKSATARVRIYPKTSTPTKDKGAAKLAFTINDRPFSKYFPRERSQKTARAPFEALSTAFETSVKIEGGGYTAQAEAVRLGLARALNDLNEKWRPRLKEEGFLTRDSRRVERKKPGLRGARRPQQWRKR
jgi:small subunit ribosomal protein S9